MTESRKWGKARGWIKQHLIDHPGGATPKEIMQACDLGACIVYSKLRWFKARGQIHIGPWRPIRDEYGKKQHEKVWVWGAGEDTPRPKYQRKSRAKNTVSETTPVGV